MAETKGAIPAPAIDMEQYRLMGEGLNSGLKTFKLSYESVVDNRISSDEEYETCVQLGNEASARAADIVAKFDPVCKMMNDTHRAMTGLRAEFAKPWTDMREKLLGMARRWLLDQEAAKVAMEREMAGQVKKRQAELLDEAEDLMSTGRIREAEALTTQANLTVAPILPSATPVVAGSRVTPKWKATCVDLTSVLVAVATGKVPLVYEVNGEQLPLITVDQRVLNAIVKRQGQSFACPGIKVERDVSIGRAGSK